MDVDLEKLIDINASALVLMTCNCQQIWDPDQIDVHKRWVIEKILEQMKQDKVGIESLSTIMDDKLALLKLNLVNKNDIAKEEITEEEPSAPREQKANSGYKAQSQDMPTKLAQERKPTSKLIMEDCVQLGLIKKKRAEYVVTQMAGKQPAEAEKEVVIELRKNLHEQVRGLIRKDKKGPWSSPKSQEDLRLEIVQTPTVRSMVFLTREILKERDEWKGRSRNSITGRIFGKKLSVDKKK